LNLLINDDEGGNGRIKRKRKGGNQWKEECNGHGIFYNKPSSGGRAAEELVEKERKRGSLIANDSGGK